MLTLAELALTVNIVLGVVSIPFLAKKSAVVIRDAWSYIDDRMRPRRSYVVPRAHYRDDDEGWVTIGYRSMFR